METRMNRRDFQKLALLLPAPLAIAVVSGRSAGIALAQSTDPEPTKAPVLVPTPACGDDDDLADIPQQTEGPFFTPDTPERHSLLEPGMAGTKLLVTGYVYTTDCQPVAGALLDFWHADADGVYDNEGYRLRGHQFADEEGRFALETIVPGLYSGRTRHIHVKAQGLGGPILTTQLYFPDEPDNERDMIFDPGLLMDVQEANDGQLAFFTFVVPAMP
jgi:protocatechuate 3,4-dioxygenase beta subunit